MVDLSPQDAERPWASMFEDVAPTTAVDALAFVAEQPSGDPATRALVGGLRADRVGFAFIAGYHAACERVFGTTLWPALCVTEQGPPHPRSIACRFEKGRLSGTKTYVTGGPLARTLFVLARAEPFDDRSQRRLVVASVRADAPGVSIEPMPPTSFVPEVPHGRVVLDGAVPDRIMENGWNHFVKPFRTIEDIHVTMAVFAYLGRALHRQKGAPSDVDAISAIVMTLLTIAGASAVEPATHRVLSGAYVLAESIWPRLQLKGEEGDRWIRDQKLLRIAQYARDARQKAAWVRTGAHTD
ncbi:MAG: acyl-CoA dehydrogenase family protein [Myxococcota bacterium]